MLALSTFTCPGLYASLFLRLQHAVSSIIMDLTAVNPTDDKTVFIEQAVTIVKLLLDQPQDSTDVLALSSVERIVLGAVRFVSALPIPVGTNISKQLESYLRVKRKVCSLVDGMMSERCRSLVLFSSEEKFRNCLVMELVDWMSDTFISDHEGDEKKTESKQDIWNSISKEDQTGSEFRRTAC